MTPQDKQSLKQAAEAATPGPWMTWPTTADNGEYTGLEILTQDGGALVTEETHPNDPDAIFIAAANPSAVLELLAENERLQRENTSYRNYIRSAPDHGVVDYD